MIGYRQGSGVSWAAAGAPEGDPADLPPPPRFADGWTLGTPSHVVRFERPYLLDSSGPDQVQLMSFCTTGRERRRLPVAA